MIKKGGSVYDRCDPDFLADSPACASFQPYPNADSCVECYHGKACHYPSH